MIFGIFDENFNQITDYASLKQNVPIRDYEGFTTYIEKIKNMLD